MKLKFMILLLLISNIFASDLQEELDNLVIVAEKDYPPITFKNKNGQPDGLAVEVAKKIMKNLNMKQKIHVWPWNRAYILLQKKPNFLVFSVSRTEEREKIFQWVGPIYSMKSSFYAKSDSKIIIKNLDDAKKLKKIGTYLNDFNEQLLKQKGFTNLEATINNILNIKKLMHNRVDVITATNVTIKDMLKKANYSMKDIKPIYTFRNTGVYFAFSKEVPFEVVDAFRKELEKLRSSCELQKIRDKWLKE